MTAPNIDSIIALYEKYAWGESVGIKPNKHQIKSRILNVPAKNIFACYKYVYPRCLEKHNQLVDRLFMYIHTI